MPTGTSGAGRPTRQRRGVNRWVVLAVVCLSVLLALMDVFIVNVALPTIGRRLDASTADLQWVVDAYSLVFAGGLLLAGHLGDRFGRRRMLQVGLVLFGLTHVLAAWSDGIGTLIAARAAMGFAAAFIYPATLAIITAAFSDARERAVAVGVWAAVNGVAIAVGPVVSGLLLEHFWWGSVFLVMAPLSVVALLLNLLLPESRDPSPGRLDRFGSLASVAAVAMLVWTVIEAPRRGWFSATTTADALAALVLLAGFVVWEARHEHPLLDVRLFADARFSAAAAAIAFSYFALFGFIFLITQFFQAVHGWGPLQTGLHILPVAAAAAVAAPAGMLLMTRIGTTIVVVIGLIMMALSFGWAATINADSPYWSFIAIAMMLAGAGISLSGGPATEAIMGALPPAKVGAGSAVNDTTREVGGTLGVAVIGSVFATVYGPSVARRLGELGLPPAGQEAAAHSVVAAAQVARAAGHRSAAAVQAVDQSFLEAYRAGAFVAAAVCLAAALGALVLLPARAKPTSVLFAPAAAEAVEAAECQGEQRTVPAVADIQG